MCLVAGGACAAAVVVAVVVVAAAVVIASTTTTTRTSVWFMRCVTQCGECDLICAESGGDDVGG